MHNDKVMEAIAALDLEPIKTKLMHTASGEGWSRAKADAMDTEYRRFLYLMHAFPDEETAPTVDVDTFWHYHILDTMKYAADCEAVFGHFLHHYPYLGMEGEHDAGAEQLGAERMRALYEATFGEAYIRAETYGAEAAAFCMVKPGADAATAQSAFCMVKPGQRATSAQGAFCMVKPGQRVKSAQAAFCMVKPGRPVRPLQGAFCMVKPGAQVDGGLASAFCMVKPGAKPVQAGTEVIKASATLAVC